MSYTPNVWVDGSGGGTPITAAELNQMEAGIDDADSRCTTLESGKQPLDADLTTIAGLTATTDNFLQAKSSAWASRTPTQVAADLVSPYSLATRTAAVAGTSLWARSNVETLGRQSSSGDIAGVSGTLWVSYFYCPVTTTITKLGMVSGGTVSVTPTLCRLGLFTADSGNALTLVARTASDTTIGNGTYSSFSRALNTTGGYPATYDLTVGTRYAIGWLQLAATATSVRAAELVAGEIDPMISARIAGQTDISASYSAGTATAAIHYQAQYMYGLPS